MQHIQVKDSWPESISDGLILSCKLCGHLPKFDYTVTDSFWRSIVPLELQTDVICLGCLDKLASSQGEDVSRYLKVVQFTGIKKTIVMTPDVVYHY